MAVTEVSRTELLRDLLAQRILVLDGAWGTMLQGRGLADVDYRGERFRDHPRDVAGDPDLLNLTRPDVVLDVHRAYLDAGADIDDDEHLHGHGDRAGRLRPRGRRSTSSTSRARGSRRQACDERDGRPRFVAGSLGPLNQTLSLSPRVDDPAYRAVTFDEVRDAYAEQVRGLIDGGVDLLLIETIFDTLNAQGGAIAAARDVLDERGLDLPLWISVTIVDLSGRTLSGQTLEAFWTSVEHARPADRRRQLLARRDARCGPTWRSSPASPTARRAATRTRACPTPSAATTRRRRRRARCSREFAESGLVNVVGGCCGTTPGAHEGDRRRRRGHTAPRAVPGAPAG